jgi:hypothetical protein
VCIATQFVHTDVMLLATLLICTDVSLHALMLAAHVLCCASLIISDVHDA